MEFWWPVRVYYEDTDHGGVVYHANYLKFMERARTEWLRTRGVEQDNLRVREEVIFAVCSAHIEFLRPARFNELLHISATVVQRGKASLSFAQEVRRENEAVLLCSATIRLACLNAKTLKATALPLRLADIV